MGIISRVVHPLSVSAFRVQLAAFPDIKAVLLGFRTSRVLQESPGRGLL